MLVHAYLAGPDVFLPGARAQANRKIAICAKYNIVGRAPLNEDSGALETPSHDEAWQIIFRTERRRRHTAVIPDPLVGLSIEDFGLPDNLMIPGTVLNDEGYPITLPLDNQDRPFDVLDVFERCVQIAASKMGKNRR